MACPTTAVRPEAVRPEAVRSEAVCPEAVPTESLPWSGAASRSYPGPLLDVATRDWLNRRDSSQGNIKCINQLLLPIRGKVGELFRKRLIEERDIAQGAQIDRTAFG